MIGDVLKAIAQLGDRRFRKVLLQGLGLTILLLVVVYAAFLWLVNLFLPDTVSLPWIGQITWVDDVVSWASIPLMLVLSVFLMVPVASAFTGFFLDDVADAVEDRYYPSLTPAPRLTLIEGLRDGATFFLVLILANIAAIAAYLVFPPAAPFIFLSMNGFLLGREYFQLVAIRRLGKAGARAARSRYAAQIWLAGTLMAVPLTVPLVNLLIPVLGAATFTHLFHRLTADRTG